MKFPLRERPFENVRLPPERYRELERTAQAVVDSTLEEFHHFVHVQNREMPKSQWKAVKKRDNITVYKELTPKHERVLGPLDSALNSSASQALLPKLLAVGTVRGSMGDMLLGTAQRDAASVLVKSSYVDDQLVDCAVLHEMRGATLEDPFRFVALKWLVKSHPTGLNSVVVPRDLVVVQSSGWIASDDNDDKGSGIGYHLLHSVDVPECPSLETRFSILRSRISIMFIFRQLTPELVEVFVTNYVEPNGSAPETVGVINTAASMSTAWRSIECAHLMKLAWVLRNKESYVGHWQKSRTRTKSSASSTMRSDDHCDLCDQRATLAGRLIDCAICDAQTCARCRVTKKVSRVDRRLELQIDKHDVCKTCFVRVVQSDARRIASEMYAGAAITPWHCIDVNTMRKGSRSGSVTSNHTRSRHNTATALSELSSGGMRTGRSRDRLPSSQDLGRTDSSLDLGDVESVDHHQSGTRVSLDPSKRDTTGDRRSPFLQQHSQVHHHHQQHQHQHNSPPPPPLLRHSHAPTISRELVLNDPNMTPPQHVNVPAASVPHHHHNHQQQHHVETLYAQMRSLQLAAEKTSEMATENMRKLSRSGTF